MKQLKTMETLRIKFKLQALEFEIEGPVGTVQTEFSDFKAYVALQLLPKLSPNKLDGAVAYGSEAPPLLTMPNTLSIEESELPLLKDIVIKDIPKSEQEWILIYCLYSSNQGKKSFTKEDVRSLFKESGRYTENRRKNFTSELNSLVDENFIKSKNETEYIILDTGVQDAKRILSGSPTERKTARKKVDSKKNKDAVKGQKSSPHTVNFVDFKASNDNIKDLKLFIGEKLPKNQNDHVAVVMYWYLKNKKIKKNMLPEEINYFLVIAGIKPPKALRQVFVNMKELHLISRNEEDGSFDLTSVGNQHVENKLPNLNGN